MQAYCWVERTEGCFVMHAHRRSSFSGCRESRDGDWDSKQRSEPQVNPLEGSVVKRKLTFAEAFSFFFLLHRERLLFECSFPQPPHHTLFSLYCLRFSSLCQSLTCSYIKLALKGFLQYWQGTFSPGVWGSARGVPASDGGWSRAKCSRMSDCGLLQSGT